MKIASLILTLLFSINVAAECVQPVTAINEGEAAPCNGYIITPEQEARFYRINEENKLRIDLGKQKDKQLDLFRLENDLLRSDISDLQKSLMQERRFEVLKNTGYALLGAGIAALIAKGVIESLK